MAFLLAAMAVLLNLLRASRALARVTLCAASMLGTVEHLVTYLAA